MIEKNFVRRILFSVFVLALCISFCFAQTKKPQKLDPTQKTKNVKKESADPFKKWLSEDVPYIISPEEKEAFKKLETNEERENFIASFWARRDPNPDTEENEFREEYYERIAYANEHFTSGIPGWKTDRGRIYITHGKPDSIESHPSGGSYDRPSYEGGGSTTTYPFETWFYRHLDGVGDGIEIEFVDATGSGEYKIARNFNEKDALATLNGRQNLDLNNQFYVRQQDLPFEKIRIINDLYKLPLINFQDFTNLANTGTGTVLNEDPIDFDLRVDFFRQSDNRVITTFTILTDNKELTFADTGGLQTATMNIFGRITAVSGNKAGAFEDVVTTNATAQELSEAKERKSIYQSAVPLSPGTYKIDIAVRDVVSGKTGIIKKGFTVPKYDPEKLSTSSLILASRLYQTTEKDIGGSFVIGDKKVVPNLSGVYKKGQEIGVYLQVYNSGIDQTTLKPSVNVNYIIIKDGKEILNQPETWEGLSDSGQRLTLAKLIPTSQLMPGNYEIKIKIFDHVNNQLLEPSGNFTIVQ